MKLISTVIGVMIFLTGCGTTRVYSPGSSPETAVVQWTGPEVLMPTFIRFRVDVPKVGEDISITQSTSNYRVENHREKTSDKFYPSNGKIYGTVKRVSEERLRFDMRFRDSDGDEIKFPFSGVHRIRKTSEESVPFLPSHPNS